MDDGSDTKITILQKYRIVFFQGPDSRE